MKFLKNLSIIICITTSFWLLIDFSLTALNLGPWRITTFVEGTKHPIYHHDLKTNLNHEVVWGNIFYELCTNEYGFKISCDAKDSPAPKTYDVAFIGDSFTEGVGMTYEDSFAGMYAKNHPELKVVNLGVRSYSPSVFYAKIQYLLKQGFYFKHVIAGIDISDIHNEAVGYVLSPDEQKILEREKEEGVPSIGIHLQNTQRKDFFIQKYFEYTWFINLIVHQWLEPKIGVEAFDIENVSSAWTHNPNAPGYGSVGIEGGIALAISSMEKLKKLLDAHNISLSVLVYPWPEQLAHKERKHKAMTIWQEFCAKNDCAYFIDANPAFFDALEKTDLLTVLNDNYIRGDFHFNRNGNALVYESIEKALH